MNKVIWTLQVLLALAFGAGGGMKLATPAESLRSNPQMGWTTQFSDGAIKAIGVAEVAGAIGLVAPVAAGILPILTPIAGVLLSILMGGAAMTHLQRGEPPIAPLVLGLLSLAVAGLRWRLMRAVSPVSATERQPRPATRPD